MAQALQAELEKRHLGHKNVKKPLWMKATVSEITDKNTHT